MTLEPKQRETLDELIDALCDDQLDDADYQRLAALLADDDALWLYVAHMNMHAGLAWDFGLTPDNERQHEQVPDADAALKDESQIPLSGLGIQPTSPLLPAPSFFSNTISYFSSGWPVAYLVATVICGLGLLIGTLTPLSHPVTIAEQSPSARTNDRLGESPMEFVAQVTGMVDCDFAESSGFGGQDSIARNRKSKILNPKSPVALGDEFALASGLMEITYTTGAKVILQGPCTYRVESKAGGYLSIGKLTAKVEKKAEGGGRKVEETISIANPKSDILNPKSASPFPLPPSALFSVRTPTATVTDLGTEFGVEVGKQGETTSHVFRGSVEVRTVGVASDLLSSQVLHENESASVKMGSDPKITVVQPATSPNFVREFPKQTLKMFDLVDVVAGGNGFSGRRNAAIDPTNGETSNKPPENLWFTSDGQYHRVPSLPLVDGVFIPAGANNRVQLDSAGHSFDGFANSPAGTSDYVWAIGVLPSSPEFGSLRFVSYRLNGLDYASADHGAIFLHANKGITFDLDAVRRKNPGVRLRRFLAVVGITDENRQDATQLGDIRVFVDGQIQRQYREMSPCNAAIPIAIPLPENSRFLTLTATDCGGPSHISGTWIVFGDPRIELVCNERTTPNPSENVNAGSRVEDK